MSLSVKQKEFIENANKRFNLKIGSRRCGKTYLDNLYRIPKKIRELSGKDGLFVILGVSKGTIERNVLQPMREIYGSQLIGNINSGNIVKLFNDDVYCLGAEKVNQVSKIQGTSVKYCYCDELAKFNRDVFEMMKGSLDKPYSMLDGALNPEHEGHWLKIEFLDKIKEDNLSVYVQYYTIYDNPFLPTDFVENFSKEMKSAGEAWYKRLILGEWCNATGMVYPCFDKNKHIKDLNLKYTQYCTSMDYGIQNPTAFTLWGKHGDKWHCIKEYYHSGRETGKQKTDEEYYQELEKLTTGTSCDELIVDPSASSFIALVRKKGKYRVRKAKNDVIDGIQAVSECLLNGSISFSTECKNTIKEFGMYRWDEKSNEDKPIKENDHAMDSIRYFVFTKKLHKPKTEDSFSPMFL